MSSKIIRGSLASSHIEKRSQRRLGLEANLRDEKMLVHWAAIAAKSSPSILIDATGRVLHLSGDVSWLVQSGSSTAESQDIYSRVIPELGSGMRAALLRATETKRAVRGRARKIPALNAECRISVEPLQVADETCYRIEFEKLAPATPTEQTANDLSSQDELDILHQTLQAITLQLHVSREEMESLNHNLQVSNEELKSTNEELAAANEELQTNNDEIFSANKSIQSQALELVEINSDFESVYNAVDFPIMVFGTDLSLKRINGAAVKEYDLSTRSVGMPFERLRLPPFLQHINDTLLDCLKRQTKTVLHMARDARNYLVFVNPVIMATGGAQSVVLVVVDNTEEVNIRRQIQESQERMLAFMNNSASIVIIKDAAGRYQFVNKRFEQVFSLAAADVIGKSDVRVLPAELAEAFRVLDIDVLQSLAPVESLDKLELGDKTIWLESVRFPIFDASGVVNALCTQAIDVTAKHQAEQKLVAAIEDVSERIRNEQQLEALVQERTLELRRALDAAKMADLAKDEFLANVSHELRTPLNAVIGMSGLARDITGDPRASAYLDKVISAGRMLASTIDDLLDISKIVAGRMELDILSFRLRQILASSIAVLGYQAEAKGLTLTGHVADDVPELVVGAPLRIKQVLINLIGNAIKFTQRGTIEVNVTSMGVRHDGHIGVKFIVADTGIGLSEEDMGRLFKPFQQADSTISRTYGGTGLGLALCKRLIELQQGQISVRSTLGKGTSFEVDLWLQADTTNALPEYTDGPIIAAKPCRYSNTRVLVVDDQPFNCELAESLLNAVGVTVDVVYNGLEALKRLRGEDDRPPAVYDMVLMDVQMPVMDGLSATRALRQSEDFATLPVVAMTAHTMLHEKETTRTAGMSDHLGKPFELQDFYRLLERWIPEHKRASDGSDAAPAALIDSPPPTEKSIFTIKGLDAAVGVARIGGKVERYQHWLHEFTSSGPAFVDELRRFNANDALPQLLDPLHAFKGRTGLLGMTELHAQLLALENVLEQQLESKKYHDAQAIDEIAATVTSLCLAIKECLPEQASVEENA